MQSLISMEHHILIILMKCQGLCHSLGSDEFWWNVHSERLTIGAVFCGNLWVMI